MTWQRKCLNLGPKQLIDVDAAVKRYLNARREFFSVAARNPEELGGNDNIVGRIGEYLALTYLRSVGRHPKKVASRSQQGHDLIEGDAQISVKLISSENANGRGLRLTDPWTELILIYLDTDSLTYQVGHLTKDLFSRARIENPSWSAAPVIKKSMLSPNGLIGKYGEVVHRSFQDH